MECPRCEGMLKINQTYSRGSGRVHSATCDICQKTFTLVTLLYGEAKNWGNGAYALDRRIASGESMSQIVKEADPPAQGGLD